MKMLSNLLSAHPFLEVALRYTLGVVFLYACVHKILHPEAFAEILYGYKILPGAAINLLAILLPFFELVCGLSLLLGFYPRSAAVLANAMLLVFILGISFNLLRGLEFDCGCFTLHKAGVYTDPGELLVRDVLMFLAGLLLMFYRGSRRLCVRNTGGMLSAPSPL
jgi:putative oxidoreductase